GTAMVSTLSGTALPVDLSQAMPLHMLFGIGGFLTFAASGVSCKLFAMFLLAPETASWQRRAGFALAALMAGLMLAGLLRLINDVSLTPLMIGVSGGALAGTALCLGRHPPALARETAPRSRDRHVMEQGYAWL